jgi:hypothetical protein
MTLKYAISLWTFTYSGHILYCHLVLLLIPVPPPGALGICVTPFHFSFFNLIDCR